MQQQPRLQDDALISRLRPEYAFLVVALLLGLCLAVLAPAGAGYDEPSHIARVDQLASGHLFAEQVDTSASNAGSPLQVAALAPSAPSTKKTSATDALYGGVVDVNLLTVAQTNLNVQARNEAQQHIYMFPAWADPYARADLSLRDGGFEPYVFSNSAQYSPLVYAPHVLGYAVAKMLGLSAYFAIVAMRVCGLLFYLVGIFVCIRIIPIGKWVLAVVAASPGTMAVASFVSPDTVTMLVCFALLATVLRIGFAGKGISTPQWVALLVLVLCLALVKMSYYPLAALLFCIPFLSSKARNPRTIAGLVCILGLGLLAFFAWFMAVRHINSGAMWGVENDPAAQVSFLLAHPLAFLQSIFADFIRIDIWGVRSIGFFTNAFETGLEQYAACGLFGVCMLICALFTRDSRESCDVPTVASLVCTVVLILGIFVVSVVLIYAALFIGYTPVGSSHVEGIQYRYFIPLSLLPVLVVPLVHARRISTFGERRVAIAYRIMPKIVFVAMLVCAIGEIVLLFMGIYR